MFEAITGKFMDEFSSITLGTLFTAVLLAFLLGLFIVLIYRVTYAGYMFSKSFALSLVLLSMITSLVILTISSNVVLSLGMVGALSIVRFRTAVKEPMDTIFMFWAIAVGIITGAGFVPVAIVATLLIGALFVVLSLVSGHFSSSSYLIVLHYDASLDKAITGDLGKIVRYKVKSKNMNGNNFELVVETKLTEKQTQKIASLRQFEGVKEVDLIAYNGGTML